MELSNMEYAIMLLYCHFFGDYVLQCDYIAQTKGKNWYHLLVHCALYTVPFYFLFGLNWQLAVVFVTHIIVDALKARYKKINYVTDQILHYLILVVYFIK